MATSELSCDGWVLHRRPFRNSSLLVDVLSPSLGRICLVARRGRRDPALQPFQPLQVTLRGRAELKTLVRVEPQAPPLQLQGQSLYCGLYLNELLMRLLHRDDPQEQLVPLYQETLSGLARPGLAQDVLLRNFEFRLLDILGYGFSLEHDLNGMPLAPQQRYRLLPDQGLNMDIRGEFEGAQLLALAAGDWRPEVRRLARDLMRVALAPHLGDKPLASRELFRGGHKAAPQQGEDA